MQILVQQAAALKHQVLANELTALLTEAELIRTYQPPFNILLKDDKSPLYIHVSKHKYPQISQVRKQDIIHQQLSGTLLGPFQSAWRVRQVLKLARQIFPWCEKPDPTFQKACFYYHLKQCPGACLGEVSVEEYQQQIGRLVAFLRGRSKTVIQELKTEMKNLAKEKQYEKAAKIRDQLLAVEAITQTPKIVKPDLSVPGLIGQQKEDRLIYLSRVLAEYGGLPKNYHLQRIEGYDVSNTGGELAVVSMVVFEGGEPAPKEYRQFHIRELDTPNDYQMLKEALGRRAKHDEWPRPQLIVIDGGRGQLRSAHSVWKNRTPLIGIAKNPDRLIIPNFDQTGEINLFHQLKLSPHHPALQLVQAIRDQSHKFSRKQHRRRLEKQFLLY